VSGHQSGAELLERLPVGQCEQTRVVELVLGVRVLALPSGDASAVVLQDAVAAGLLEDTDNRAPRWLARPWSSIFAAVGLLDARVRP
jgi:hypothetical protein